MLDVGAREEPAPNGEPVDIEGEAPNGLELEVVVVAPKLLPNGDGAVVLLPPNPPPNMPVLGAEVVVGLGALPKPLPNGLEDEVAEAPNILDVGAGVVIVGEAPNPLPKGLGSEDVAKLNALVLGAEVVAVVEIAAPNPVLNGVELGAVEVAALPKSVPVVVGAAAPPPPNERLEEVVGVKLPKIGFEPKPVDIIGLFVGEVD